jgi:hypothetical protein
LFNVVRLAAAPVLFGIASFLSANVTAQNCDLPAVPDATITRTQDRDQILCQLGIKLPMLPSRATDPDRPQNSFPKDSTNPEGSYADAIGNTVERTDFGLWNGYVEQSGLGAINIGGINPGYTPIDLFTIGWNIEHIGKIQTSSGHDLQNWQVVGGDGAVLFDVDRRTGEIRFAPDDQLLVRSRHPIGDDELFSLFVTVSDGINTSRSVEVKIEPPRFF